LRRTTSGKDPFDLSVRKKPDPSAVRRPEWVGRTIGSRDWPRLHVVYGSQPQSRLVASLGCDERQHPAAAGTDSHGGRAITAGVSWPFEIRW
jgi:hypothetical protein